jgi:acetyl-CoA carboxylase biotin carboxylase subunit
MIKRILIANRGEIALRIIRSCKELGIVTIAVWSEADRDSLQRRFADEDVCIGPSQADESYLNVPRIIAAAEITNADAIHPGYGFLAENPEFSEICSHHRITFVGPSAEMIQNMGNKPIARALMERAGVPVTPGSKGEVENLHDARKIAGKIGYPIIVKASCGGGGKGMRIVEREADLERNFDLARTESEKAFKEGGVYIEKYVAHPRHIEIQLLGDGHGNMISLGERDCTIQRRYQKLIEESPSPVVDSSLRKKLVKAAVKGARKIGYKGAGTIEFLLDDNGNFYFMEMNTRIQVEHPVTEMVCGVDLIKEQIKVAAGEAISLKDDHINLNGHAIECRINAEDPDDGFRPSPGKITSLNIPGGPGVRVDTHIYAQYTISPYYDSLLAKLIVHDWTREEAIRKMRRALEEFVVEGVRTTIPFHQKILDSKMFSDGNYDTHFIERFH